MKYKYITEVKIIEHENNSLEYYPKVESYNSKFISKQINAKPYIKRWIVNKNKPIEKGVNIVRSDFQDYYETITYLGVDDDVMDLLGLPIKDHDNRVKENIELYNNNILLKKKSEEQGKTVKAYYELLCKTKKKGIINSLIWFINGVLLTPIVIGLIGILK